MFVSYWLSMTSIHASRYFVRGECVHFKRGKAAYITAPSELLFSRFWNGAFEGQQETWLVCSAGGRDALSGRKNSPG